MKKLYKYIVLVIGILAFSACADEELVGSFGETGSDVILNLSLKPEISKEIVNSRAETYENKLYDLHIYVFEPTREVNGQQIGGKLIGYEKLDFGDDGVIHENELKTYSVNVRTKTGTSYIYALANINTGSIYKLSDPDNALLNVTTYATNNKTTKEEVDALRAAVEASTLNLTTFKNINFNRTLPTGHEVISPTPTDKIFMMSGYLNDGAAVTIQKNGTNVSIKEDVNVIKLYRILAKNTLTIQSVGNGVFTPKSYRLYNVPVGGQLVPNANISTANTAVDYTTEKTTTVNVESHYQEPLNESSFTFYYPENLQATTSAISVWKDRETNDYSSGSKVYTKAPAKAAYIEIQGDYEDTTNKITANVTYTIHLGNFSKSLTDFNVVRNNHYIYTVKVNGVNDIVAEAKIKDNNSNDVDNPYAEGLVIEVGGGQHYSVDAHYEARVLKFTKSSIQALKSSHTTYNPGYILNVNTPFGKTKETVNVKSDGVYTMDNNKICTITEATDIDNTAYATKKDQLFQNEADFRWMRFVRNTTGNVTKTGNDISLYTCKYPGDQNRYSSTNKGGWMNVFELLAELYYTDDDSKTDNNTTDDDVYGNSGEVYYTCFIDENYYADKAWSAYVNKEPRTMQIANNLFISEDKKSIYAEVAYSIAQRSIATFYKDESLVAFGTEIFDEEDLYHTTEHPTRLGSSNSTSLYDNLPIDGLDDWDGFTSTKNTNINTDYNKWYENVTRVVTTTTTDWWGNETTKTEEYPINVNYIENIQPLYLSAAKACMSRNRDLNGNGNIDGGEVRWYLASGGQDHALYIAKTSLPTESWLITDAELSAIDNYYIANNGWGSDQSGHDYRGRYHYYTSSDKGTYWPEEGLTLNDATTSSFMQRAELVRCVRTLKSGTSASPEYGLEAPQKYYTFQNNIFYLTGIETRRGAFDGLLPNHNELQEQNELYRSFEVAADGNDKTATSLDALTGNANDPCSSLGANWRTPNQKELALMLAEMKSTMISGRYVPRTRFSGYKGSKTNGQFNNSLDALGYHWHDRVGFQIGSNGEYNLISNTNNVNVRCVRDVK